MKWRERKQLAVVTRDERERKMQRMVNVVKLHGGLQVQQVQSSSTSVCSPDFLSFAHKLPNDT